MNRKKRITNKPAGKCHAQNVINIESGSRPESHFFQMELMKIKTAGNHAELKKKRLYPTAARPDIRPVPLDRTKSSLGLNTSVHPEQRAVNAVQIIQNFCVKLRQLLVQTNDPVSLSLTKNYPITLLRNKPTQNSNSLSFALKDVFSTRKEVFCTIEILDRIC